MSQGKISSKNKRLRKRIQWCLKIRENHEALGVCKNCGIRPKVEGRMRCAKCLKTNAEGTRRRQKRLEPARKALGLCVCCGKEATLGITTCGHCNEIRCEANSRQRKRKIYTGMCQQCGVQPPKSDHIRCQDCLDYQRIHMKKWRKQKADGLIGVTVLKMAG